MAGEGGGVGDEIKVLKVLKVFRVLGVLTLT